ncbi:MAG: hypothetical protein HY393_03685 [Candidatus Diapherotrites archaeon]|nr:hypothetical protein [Candidatus Diapherotrites archaeon]
MQRKKKPIPGSRTFHALPVDAQLRALRRSVKYVFNPERLRTKASRGKIFKRTKKEYVLQDIDSALDWAARKEKNKRLKTLYEWRQRKPRPLKSDDYYREIGARYGRVFQKYLEKLDDRIYKQKEHVNALLRKRPKENNPSTNITDLFSHNLELYTIYTQLAALYRSCGEKLVMLKTYFQRWSSDPLEIREHNFQIIKERMESNLWRLQTAEKKAAQARERVEYVSQYPEAALQDHKTIENHKIELEEIQKNALDLFREYTEAKEKSGLAALTPQELKTLRARLLHARIKHWTAYKTLMTLCFKSLKRYGTTLSGFREGTLREGIRLATQKIREIQKEQKTL